MADSCPVCYERFTVVDERDRTYCLRLNDCSHLVCISCVTSDLSDNSYYCPECGTEHSGEEVADFSVPWDPALPGVKDSPSSSSSCFASTVLADEGESMKSKRVRQNCKVEGCFNKVLHFDLCLAHSKNRSKSITEIENIAQWITTSKFNVSTFGDTIKEYDEQVNGHYSDPDYLKNLFREQGRLELSDAIELIERARAVMMREPNVLRLDAPVIAVGDIHGQFFDLLNLLEEGGEPGSSSDTYLFLGDYVDRGSFSCEVILLLLSLKVKYPDKIWLLRGNHECSSVSGHFGFKDECKLKYGLAVYYKFMLCFQTMPIAAVISTAYGDIFACHGGLSPKLRRIEEIEEIDRFVEPESDDKVLDILWSDPISEDLLGDLSEEEYVSFMDVEWKSNPARGCSVVFGYKALNDFLCENKLVCLVRAHEVQKEGYRRHFDSSSMAEKMRGLLQQRVDSRAEDAIPPLVTIFSAPNYCDRYGNKGAILRIDMALDNFQIIQYNCVPHPLPHIRESESEKHSLAIVQACPYMPTSFKDLVMVAVTLGREGDDSEPFDNPVSARSDLAMDLVEAAGSSGAVAAIEEDGEEVAAASLAARVLTDVFLEPPAPETSEDDEIDTDDIQRIDNPMLDAISAMLGDTESSSAAAAPAPEPERLSVAISHSSRRRQSVTISLVRGVGDAKVFSAPSSSERGSDGVGTAIGNISTANSLDHTPPALSERSPSPLEISTSGKSSSGSARKSMRRQSIAISSDMYTKALFSDAINEVHPERLQFNADKTSEELRSLQLGLNDSPTISVRDLRKRFERGFFDDSQLGSRQSRLSSDNEEMKREIQCEISDSGISVSLLQQRFGGAGAIKKSTISRRGSSVGEYSSGVSLNADGSSYRQMPSSSSSSPDRSHRSSLSALKDALEEENDHNYIAEDLQRLPPVAEDVFGVASRELAGEGGATYSRLGQAASSGVSPGADEVEDRGASSDSGVLFNQTEVLALRLMFSLFDRQGNGFIEYDDLVAYAEETQQTAVIRDAGFALEVMDMDGDGRVGLLDFFLFAARLKELQNVVAVAA